MAVFIARSWLIIIVVPWLPGLAFGQLEYLHQQQLPDGRWRYGGPEVPPEDPRHLGATALAALALLEAGQSPDHPAIQQARAMVLYWPVEQPSTLHLSAGILLLHRLDGQRCSTLTKLTREVLFLDDPTTINSIRYETKLRRWARLLMEGQEAHFGGWGPFCPSSTASVDLFHTQMALLALNVARHHGLDVKECLGRTLSAWRWPLHYGSRGLEPLQPGFTFALWHYRWHQEIGHLRDWHGLDPDFARRILLSHREKDGAWRKDLTHGPIVETAFALGFIHQGRLRPQFTREVALLSTSLLVWQEYTQTVQAQQNQPIGAAPKRPRLPPATPQVEIGRTGQPGEAAALGKELQTPVQPERFAEILELLEKTRGTEYTQVLAAAIPHVQPDRRDPVRQSLQKRLARMSVNTLRQYLQVDDHEIQRAAITVLGQKDYGKELIPDLIPYLRKEKPLAETAHATLKKLSGRDFGRDVKAWEKWWQAEGRP